VRALELGCFEIPIKTMPEGQKAELFPELLRAIESEDSSVRNNALVALQYYSSQKETVVPLIVNALQDPDPVVRMMTVRALVKIDPQNTANSKSVSVLVGCLGAPDGFFRGADAEAATILGQLHREPDVAVPALIRALQSDDIYLRYNAAAALGKFGSQAKAAIPALTKALEDSNAQVRRQAAAALNLINSGAAAN